jgi:hypothetical protein
VYLLEVFFPNDKSARHFERMQSAQEVLARIPELLREHEGCEKVVVNFGGRRLFSVDCEGNTLND